MNAAKSSYPDSLIFAMHAARSDLKMRANNFEKKLLNFLHSMGLENSLQSAQLAYSCPMQQERILHQDAFSFSWQPGQVPDKYFLQVPQ
jgi:hypothetical protein